MWSVQQFFSSHPPPYFLLFISIMGACLCGGVGAHGWIVRFCQPLVQFPSWSWLPKGSKLQESQARNLHLALQLTINIDKKNSMRIFKHGTQYLDSNGFRGCM